MRTKFSVNRSFQSPCFKFDDSTNNLGAESGKLARRLTERVFLAFLSAPISRSLSPIDRELERQRQWGLQKPRLKTECTLLQTLSVIALTPSRSIRQMVEKCFGSWIIKDCIEIQGKEKKVVVLCCRPQQNAEKLGRFTPSSWWDGKEMYKKAWGRV